MSETILIIGGMGPQASAEALRRVVDIATIKVQKKDNSFPKIIVLSLPVPEFASNQHNIEPAFRMIEEEVRKAEIFKPKVTMIACNTAHLLFKRLESSFPNLGLCSLIDAVVDKAKAKNMQTIGILASPTTIQTKLYQEAFEKAGIHCNLPSEEEIMLLDAMIKDTIRHPGKSHKTRLHAMADNMLAQGCDVVLLGCTELPIIFGNHNNNAIIDSLNILSQTLIDKYFQKSDIME